MIRGGSPIGIEGRMHINQWFLSFGSYSCGHRIESRRAVPDMELTKIGQCKQQPFAIRRHSWGGGTLTDGGSIEHEFTLTELLCPGIERPAIDVVLQQRVGTVEFGIDVVRLLLIMGRNVVEPMPVRTPRGERFELIGTAIDVVNLVLCGIIQDQIAAEVDDFNLLYVTCVENLSCLVHGEGYDLVVQRMPCRIDACRKRAVGLQVDLRGRMVVDEHRAAFQLANVEQRVPRPILILRNMAVDALAFLVLTEHHVVKDDAFIEVRNVTLAYHHVLVVYV